MKTAVIGVGRMGRRHLQVVRDLRLDLVGVADISSVSLEQARKEQELGAGLLATDVPGMLAAGRAECVIVATTAPTHCEYVCAAAKAGARFILCEKPMATSLAECDEMLECCAKHGAKLAVNHQMRFMEQYTVPKGLLSSEEFGGLSSITVVAGNFGLAMNGSHYFEMFRFMADEAPHEVTAWFSPEKVPNPRGPQFEDVAGCVRLTSASGKRFYLDCSADQGHGVRVCYAARYGQIYVDEINGAMFAAVRQEPHRGAPTTRYGMPATEIHTQIAPADSLAPSRAVLNALLQNANAPTGEDGRLAVRTLMAAHLSNERGHCPVALESVAAAKTRRFPWA